MSRIEDLVPPLEMCSKIPVGKFEDSALVLIFWHKSPNTPVEIRTRCEVENDPEFDDLVEDQRIIIYPAPTLAEILEALPTRIVYAKMPFYLFLLDTRNKPLGDWQIGYAHEAFYGLAVAEERRERDKNPPTAALRLWLKLYQLSRNATTTPKGGAESCPE